MDQVSLAVPHPSVRVAEQGGIQRGGRLDLRRQENVRVEIGSDADLRVTSVSLIRLRSDPVSRRKGVQPQPRQFNPLAQLVEPPVEVRGSIGVPIVDGKIEPASAVLQACRPSTSVPLLLVAGFHTRHQIVAWRHKGVSVADAMNAACPSALGCTSPTAVRTMRTVPAQQLRDWLPRE